MRLDRVEIVGFKSFCDKQELSFQGGVTGIVGPNGCGKSNISDAISWVLGEQSVKSLRGAAMEDVIFAGSQSRQPVGMAEVNLQVSGLNGNSPDGNPECVVTRRLYRNGESEYLMNGSICRLRDIHELFMDTGLGSKAYSIIEQGKIGLILSSKPADRRALIEEAAGITKYKLRKRQTALKLEAAQQNLLRVNDIVHEVEKQLESLKRQAGKARRYRALRDEMQAIERVVFGVRFVTLREQATALGTRFGEEAEREQHASIALGAEEAQMETRRAALYEEESRLEAGRARLSELTLAVDRHQSKSGYCQEQIAQTQVRAQEARSEAIELEGRLVPLAASLQTRRAESQQLRGELQTAETDTRAAETAVQTSTASQVATERALEATRETQAGVLGRIAAFGNAKVSVSANAERAGADILRLDAETADLTRERERVNALGHTARTRGEDADALLGTLREQREQTLETAEAARARAQAQGREADALQSERDSQAGRLASLEELVATHAAFDAGVRSVLALAGQQGGIEALGVVADAVETESAYERAVESFLGDGLQAVLTPDPQQALLGIRHLEQTGEGRGTFLPLRGARAATRPSPLGQVAAQEPAVRALLSDLYRVTGPHADAIRAALPDALVVDTLEQAFEILSRHGALPCVTLAGETLQGCLVEGGRGSRGLLAPKREVREVTARLEEIETRLGDTRRSQADEAAQAEQAFLEARALESRIHSAEKDLVAIRHDLASATEEANRLSRKASVLLSERSQAEQQRQAAATRLAEIETTLLAAEAERVSGSERLAELHTAVAAARLQTEAAQARHAEVRSVLAALRERVSAAESDCRRLAQDHADLSARISAAGSRAQELDRRGLTLQTELQEAERLLAEALVDRDRVAGEVAVVEDQVRDIRNEIDGRDQSLKERRREREALRGALSELEVARARTESDLEHLARECQAAILMPAAEAATTLTEEDRARDVAGLETEIQEMRERLDKMGPVNILAVEQAQELEERHTFLTAQRQDLLDSIAELDRAVKVIDKTSRERFAEAFAVINQHFGEIFKQLFGGGTAGLSLIDEEDILESGIDVMAQPPGKRLQNVMLLSGGEKAMTAISLLFAIFQYKPSPFCILDEVDAPLDDANIGRFVRMLEGLKAQTQFVLITHSRRTMEIADQLYGVTMEEPGVSKLVSVRFGH